MTWRVHTLSFTFVLIGLLNRLVVSEEVSVCVCLFVYVCMCLCVCVRARVLCRGELTGQAVINTA